MNKNTVFLSNGWTADFTNRGEFRMGAEAWVMLLSGPDHRQIKYFETEIVLVNDNDGKLAQSCIELSDDGKHGYLTTGIEHGWVIDFTRSMIAPHRVYLSHHQGEKYLQACEQPVFKRTQEYVRIGNRLVYITFPFCKDEEFTSIWADYIQIRKRQLDEVYFKDK